MKASEALSLVEKLAWDQTKAALGSVPWPGEVDQESRFAQWIAYRDDLQTQLMLELESAGLVEKEDNLST